MPAVKLKAYGWRAVPQLVEALSDARLTRVVSITFSRSRFLSQKGSVDTVGDVAADILDEIFPFYAGDWYPKTEEGTYPTNAQIRQNRIAQIKFWLEELKQKGERAVLIEQVSEGSEHSRLFASHLVEKFPADAPAAIREGLRKAKETSRYALVGALAKCQTEAADEVLIAALQDSDREVRSLAVEVLTKRKPDVAYSHLVSEFKKAPEDGTWAAKLILMGRADALELVMATWEQQPADSRYSILGALEAMVRSGEYEDFSDNRQRITDPVLLKLAEKYTVAALTDKRRCDSYGPEASRLCDVAANYLSKLYPGKYILGEPKTRQGRDEQRIRFANLWRAENGLPELRSTPAPTINLVDPMKVNAALDAFLASPSLDKRDSILGLGLGALKGITQRANAERDGEKKTIIAELSRELACKVTELEIIGAVPESVRSRVASLQGKTLTAERLRNLFLDLRKMMSPRSAGFSIEVNREGFGAGALLLLSSLGSDLKEAPTGGELAQTRWVQGESQECVTVGYREVFAFEDSDLEPWRKTLSTDPNKEFAMLFELRQRAGVDDLHN